MSVNHNIAILIANGFNESKLVEIQKTLRSNNMVAKMVSPESGVVNGWADNTWGCFFPVDAAINEALASDYTGLIVMGGDKSIQRLMKTAHTERFVNSFARVGKTVLTLDEASSIAPAEQSDMIMHVDTGVESVESALSQFIDNMLASDVEMDMAA